MQLNLAHLYPNHLNIYGDQGNIDTLTFRCQQRGIKLNVIKINPGDALKSGSFDLLFAGGGQDSQQLAVASDLLSKRSVLHKAMQAKIPMLTICGSFQLFGDYFRPFKGPKIKGIGLFDAYTVASSVRKIGNLLIKTNLPLQTTSNLVGFENHSGNTFLGQKSQALGTVISGQGNNGKDKTEGAMIGNCFGCYLHGSLLPKNPHFADYLLSLTLKTKGLPSSLKSLNDDLEWLAHRQAVKITSKPRW